MFRNSKTKFGKVLLSFEARQAQTPHPNEYELHFCLQIICDLRNFKVFPTCPKRLKLEPEIITVNRFLTITVIIWI